MSPPIAGGVLARLHSDELVGPLRKRGSGLSALDVGLEADAECGAAQEPGVLPDGLNYREAGGVAVHQGVTDTTASGLQHSAFGGVVRNQGAVRGGVAHTCEHPFDPGALGLDAAEREQIARAFNDEQNPRARRVVGVPLASQFRELFVLVSNAEQAHLDGSSHIG